eukprot:NODE_1665_length_565_cov_0.776018_g1651_i0.p1 GENE.NODE_1665_length_565_cov_0.776018_g1651_i0~~NODE_1665_length_565_cov_0.776018_g1651_i0.p1  ORF type:complete len:116 (+),score=0.90 NODE_1665_length_565_cov_0.776018_g1651_i0:195-542(+)
MNSPLLSEFDRNRSRDLIAQYRLVLSLRAKYGREFLPCLRIRAYSHATEQCRKPANFVSDFIEKYWGQKFAQTRANLRFTTNKLYFIGFYRILSKNIEKIRTKIDVNSHAFVRSG